MLAFGRKMKIPKITVILTGLCVILLCAGILLLRNNNNGAGESVLRSQKIDTTKTVENFSTASKSPEGSLVKLSLIDKHNDASDFSEKINKQKLRLKADSGNPDNIHLGETLKLQGGEGIDTRITNNTYTIQEEDASSTNKGISKYDDSYFNVSGGNVTIDDIYVRNTGDTINGDLTVTGSINVPNIAYSVSGTTDRITSTGGQNPIIDIASNYTGQSSIINLGTITTGSWHGTSIADAYVDNNITASNYLLLAGGTMSGAINMGSQNITNGGSIAGSGFIGSYLKPSADSTTAIQIQKSDGTNILNVDTSNSRVGIGTNSPASQLDILGVAGGSPELRLKDADGTLGYMIRQTSDSSNGSPYNDILQIGSNVQPGGGIITPGEQGVFMQFERSWLDSESPQRMTSEWHVNFYQSNGTLKRTLQSNIDNASGNGSISFLNSVVAQNAFSDQDYTTASGGTNGSAWGGFQIGGGTLTSLNANVTRTDAASLSIGGPPTAGVNTTISHPWTISSGSGYSYFNDSTGGGIYIGGTATRANKPPFSLSVEGLTALGSALSVNNFNSAAYNLILGSGSGNNGMTIFSGNTSTGNIYFTDSNVNDANNRIGRMVYDHSADQFSFSAGDKAQLSFGPANGFNFYGYYSGVSQATMNSGYFTLYNQRASTGVTQMTLRAGAGQSTIQLFDWRDNSNNVLGLMDPSGNVGIGATSFGTNAVKVLAIGNGTAPTTSPANMVQLWSEGGELKVRDATDHTTVLSPHDFSILGEPSEDMAWSYYSEKNGKAISVDMTKALRVVEGLSGEQLIHIKNLDTGTEQPQITTVGKVDELENQMVTNNQQLITINTTQDEKIAVLEARIAGLENANTNTNGMDPQVKPEDDNKNGNDNSNDTEGDNNAAIKQSDNESYWYNFAGSVVTIIKELSITAKVTFSKAATFLADVTFGGRVTFADRDMGGFAKIKKGDDSVEVNFEKDFQQEPIVTITPRGTSVTAHLKDSSPNGFTIQLDGLAKKDITFNWTALAIDKSKVSESKGNGVEEPKDNNNDNIENPDKNSNDNQTGSLDNENANSETDSGNQNSNSNVENVNSNSSYQ